MKKLILLVIITLNSSSILNSQTSISGQIIQDSNGETVLFASVALYKDSVIISVVESDLDGNYHFSKIDPGNYRVEASFLGLETTSVELQARAGKITPMDIKMKRGEHIIICCGCNKLYVPKKTEDLLAFTIPYNNLNTKKKFEKETEIIEKEEFNFSVYPNPASDKVTISSQFNYEKIMIIDMNGRIVLGTYFESGSEVIPVHNIAKGLYNVVVQLKEGQLHSKRIMINSN